VLTILNFSNQTINVSLTGDLHFGTYENVFEESSITINEDTEILVPAWDFKVYQAGGSSTASNEDNSNIPFKTSLDQNYPNPFNPSTIITYELPVASLVEINLYNILGNKVAGLLKDFKSAGSHSVEFNAKNLSSGVYIYRLESNNSVISRKMILVK
jgi:hypothetical protein